jgi:hypothetical protein
MPQVKEEQHEEEHQPAVAVEAAAAAAAEVVKTNGNAIHGKSEEVQQQPSNGDHNGEQPKPATEEQPQNGNGVGEEPKPTPDIPPSAAVAATEPATAAVQ